MIREKNKHPGVISYKADPEKDTSFWKLEGRGLTSEVSNFYLDQVPIDLNNR